jgi:hypothetical protein
MDEYDADAGVEALHAYEGGGSGLEISDDEGSDAEENVIERTDMVLLAARTDDDASVLEVCRATTANCPKPASNLTA